jgi:transcriptional regulator with XRE-family HTH domain
VQDKYDENVKIAVILRTIRGILGLSQTRFAEYLGQPKSTIARAESLVLPMKVDLYFKILKAMKEQGIEIDAMSDEPTFKLTEKFMVDVGKKLLDK